MFPVNPNAEHMAEKNLKTVGSVVEKKMYIKRLPKYFRIMA